MCPHATEVVQRVASVNGIWRMWDRSVMQANIAACSQTINQVTHRLLPSWNDGLYQLIAC